MLSECCLQFSRDELVERLIAADVLVAPIQDITEVASDPQVVHNRMVTEVTHAKLGPYKVTGVPIKMGSTPGSVRLAPPVHGQHSREILAELGYGEGEVEELARAKTIYSSLS